MMRTQESLERELDELYREFIAQRPATQEAVRSNLPGRENGPADAYRHLLWTGELTRRFGPLVAKAAGEWHEKRDLVPERFWWGSRAERKARAMDRNNNEIGIAIGRRAKTWDDVVRAAREVIDASPRDGHGGPGRARWMHPDSWDKDPPRPNWPAIDWHRGIDPDQPINYRFGGSEHHHRRHDLSSTGPEGQSRAPASAGRASAFADPEIMFRYADPANGGQPNPIYGGRLRNPALDRLPAGRRAADGSGGGAVHVTAHRRVQEGRPVPVEAHTRAPPAPHRR